MRGWLDRHKEHFEEAFALAQRAVTIDGHDPLAHFALGLASLHTQRVEMAIRENEEAIWINPSDAAALTNLGNCNNDIDRPSVAFDGVSRAMRLSPARSAHVHGCRPSPAAVSSAASTRKPSTSGGARRR